MFAFWVAAALLLPAAAGAGEADAAPEVYLRQLSAADAPVQPWATAGGRKGVLAVAAAAPGVADNPYAGRLEEWRAAGPMGLTAPQMAAVLRQAVRERPAEADGKLLQALDEAARAAPMAKEEGR